MSDATQSAAGRAEGQPDVSIVERLYPEVAAQIRERLAETRALEEILSHALAIRSSATDAAVRSHAEMILDHLALLGVTEKR